jgi:hypothetical protein
MRKSTIYECTNYDLEPHTKIRNSKIVNRKFKTILRPVDGLTTMIKYTAGFLTKIEDIISESDYILRYEKGNFKSGYCLLKEQKIMIVNKFYTTEGKINALTEILRTVELDQSKFTEKSQQLYAEITQTELKA